MQKTEMIEKLRALQYLASKKSKVLTELKIIDDIIMKIYDSFEKDLAVSQAEKIASGKI